MVEVMREGRPAGGVQAPDGREGYQAAGADISPGKSRHGIRPSLQADCVAIRSHTPAPE